MGKALTPRRILALAGGRSAERSARFLALAFVAFQGDVMRWSLDPRTPFQTYKPPPAPDYAQRKAWFLLPADRELRTRQRRSKPVSSSCSPTTFEGGKKWNAPVTDRAIPRPTGCSGG